MICPYNRRSEKQALFVHDQYDDDGRHTDTQQTTSFTFKMMECPKEDCAVWRDGKCHYAAINLDNQ